MCVLAMFFFFLLLLLLLFTINGIYQFCFSVFLFFSIHDYLTFESKGKTMKFFFLFVWRKTIHYERGEKKSFIFYFFNFFFFFFSSTFQTYFIQNSRSIFVCVCMCVFVCHHCDSRRIQKKRKRKRKILSLSLLTRSDIEYNTIKIDK